MKELDLFNILFEHELALRNTVHVIYSTVGVVPTIRTYCTSDETSALSHAWPMVQAVCLLRCLQKDGWQHMQTTTWPLDVTQNNGGERGRA